MQWTSKRFGCKSCAHVLQQSGPGCDAYIHVYIYTRNIHCVESCLESRALEGLCSHEEMVDLSAEVFRQWLMLICLLSCNFYHNANCQET
jgi:hypothetical protein